MDIKGRLHSALTRQNQPDRGGTCIEAELRTAEVAGLRVVGLAEDQKEDTTVEPHAFESEAEQLDIDSTEG